MIKKIQQFPFKKWAIISAFTFLGLSVISVVLLRFLPVYVTPLVFIRSVEQLRDKERDFRCDKDWVPMESISIHMIKAVVAAEDQRFMEHNGFDFIAIENAMAYNKKHKNKKKLGASTITQQTAKNVFLWHGRNWVRKGLEAYFTILIEAIWSKERIMEVYLNVVELGDGIYGVEAAAQHYYKKSAAQLNKHESAMLAAILPCPLKFNPIAPSSYLTKRKTRILKQLSSVEHPDVAQVLGEDK